MDFKFEEQRAKYQAKLKEIRRRAIINQIVIIVIAIIMAIVIHVEYIK